MWPDIIRDAIDAFVGFILGGMSGFYFERRQTREARQAKTELEQELAAIRTSVYSVGGAPRSTPHAGTPKPDLTTEVMSRARATQNADGRVSRTLLISHFFGLGHKADDINEAIGELCEAGKVRENDKWLEVM